MADSQPYLFELFRGDDFTLRIEVTDDSDTPIDVSGWAFKATLKLNTQAPDDQAPVKVNIPPATGNEAEQGIVHLVLPNDQTRNLKPATYFFDLQRESNETVNTVLMGRVRVHADVTRRQGNG